MATAKKATPVKAKPATKVVKTAKTIRNLHNNPVHLRIVGASSERPFFVQLKPRGQSGDTERVPAELTDVGTFVNGVDTLFEVITQTEAKKIAYPPTGYLHDVKLQIVRPQETVVMTAKDWDGKGRRPTDSNVVMTPTARARQAVAVADLEMKTLEDDRRPGADDMIPAGVDLTSRQVVIERVAG